METKATPTATTPETKPAETAIPLSPSSEGGNPTIEAKPAPAQEKEPIKIPDLTPEQLELVLAGVKRRIVVDGEEHEVGIKDLEKRHQLERASYKKMQEAADLKKQVQEIAKLMKTDPRKALTHPLINVDIRKFAEEVLQAEIEEELLDEKDKKIRDYERKEAASAKAEAEKQTKLQEEQLEAQTVARFEAMKGLVNKSLEIMGTPGSKPLFKRMVSYLQTADIAGDLPTPEELVGAVTNEDRGYVSRVAKELPVERLAALLGEDVLNAIRKWDVERLNRAPVKQAEAPKAPSKPKSPSKKKTWDEMVRDAYENADK